MQIALGFEDLTELIVRVRVIRLRSQRFAKRGDGFSKVTSTGENARRA